MDIAVPFVTQIESGQDPGHPTRSGEENCGPACCTMLLSWAGVPGYDVSDSTVDRIRVDISGSDTPGNRPVDLNVIREYLAVNGLNISLISRELIRSYLAQGVPVLWLGDNSKLAPQAYPDSSFFGGHFVVLRGIEGDMVRCNDPLLAAPVQYTLSSLLAGCWQAVAVPPAGGVNPPQSSNPAPIFSMKAPPILGWEVLGFSPGVTELVIKSKASHIMTIDPNIEQLRKISAALPAAKILYRPYLPPERWDDPPPAIWESFFGGERGKELLSLIDEIESPWCEPDVSSPAACAIVAQRNMAWLGLCQKANKIPVLLALAVGNPGNLLLWASLRQVCSAVALAAGYISTHCYSLELTDDAKRDLQWTANRFEEELKAFPWLGNVKRYITEFGFDHRPWKVRGTSPVAYATYLVSQASYWAGHTDIIKACFPFCIGDNGSKNAQGVSEWEQYRIDDTPAGEMLAQAIAAGNATPPAPLSNKEKARAIQERAGLLAGDLNKAGDTVKGLVQCVNQLVGLVE